MHSLFKIFATLIFLVCSEVNSSLKLIPQDYPGGKHVIGLKRFTYLFEIDVLNMHRMSTARIKTNLLKLQIHIFYLELGSSDAPD